MEKLTDLLATFVIQAKEAIKDYQKPVSTDGHVRIAQKMESITYRNSQLPKIEKDILALANKTLEENPEVDGLRDGLTQLAQQVTMDFMKGE